MVRGFYSNEAFGIDFPSTCPDGAGFDGTDVQAFQAALLGAVPEMEGWIEQATALGTDAQALVSTGAILDALEWLAAHVGESRQGIWHGYFRHHHLTWDRDIGRQNFCDAVNAVFSRNGLAYEMATNGQIQRVVNGPSAEAIARARFTTGDNSLDELLEVARRRFFDRDPDAGQRSIEALWDAFERIKTVEDPTDKRKSAEEIISKVVHSKNARALIETEMLALTEIGNTWRIRHHEVGKTELRHDPVLRDYLFLRMFDLIRLLLNPRRMLQ